MKKVTKKLPKSIAKNPRVQAVLGKANSKKASKRGGKGKGAALPTVRETPLKILRAKERAAAAASKAAAKAKKMSKARAKAERTKIDAQEKKAIKAADKKAARELKELDRDYGRAPKGKKAASKRAPKKASKKQAGKKSSKRGGKKASESSKDAGPGALARGTAFEMREHPTLPKKMARQVAQDHLNENPRYYD